MAKPKNISRESILDAAEQLLIQRGFHGFSTRELADEVGLSSASLHHHFDTKAHLASAVAGRCRDRINLRMAEIARDLEGFWTRIHQVHESMHVDAPLLGILAADFPSVPAQVQGESRQLFANLLGWLTRFAVQARSEGDLPPDTAAESVAADLLSTILGRAMLGRTEQPAAPPLPASAWAWQR